MFSGKLTIVAAGLLALAAVGCGRSKRTASAFETDGSTVIYQEVCKKKRFVECGRRVRRKAKALLCERHGLGNHDFLYRFGKNKPIRSKARCK